MIGVSAIGIAAAHAGDKSRQAGFALGAGGCKGRHRFQLFLAEGQMTRRLEISTHCAGVMTLARPNVTEVGHAAQMVQRQNLRQPDQRGLWNLRLQPSGQ